MRPYKIGVVARGESVAVALDRPLTAVAESGRDFALTTANGRFEIGRAGVEIKGAGDVSSQWP